MQTHMSFWLRKNVKFLVVFLLGITISQVSRSEVLIDILGTGSHIEHKDDFLTEAEALARCQSFAIELGYAKEYCHHAYYVPLWEAGWLQDSSGVFHLGDFYHGKCTPPLVFNKTTANCGNDQQKGAPQALSCVGNPINLSIGNKFQAESDYPSNGAVEFSRYYNSSDGFWLHTYADRLRFAIGHVAFIRSDGQETFFSVDGDLVTADLPGTGQLSKEGSEWNYISPNSDRLSFDSNGRLIRVEPVDGRIVDLSYTGSTTTVRDSAGNALSFTEDANHQPLTLNAPGVQVTYGYDANKNLISVTRTAGSATAQRKMLYEDSRNNRLLTGILDESGTRLATWGYDSQGRAISSEHANGAEKVTLAYNADGSTTVTNQYGKTTTYRFQLIQGVRQIVAIEGAPTPNCPNSNSTFTYDSRGLLKTKTDNKGNLTTYDYNDRGLEVSRTEAAGTLQARTITTEWHPTLFLKTQITEPERVIRYQYDEQGRRAGQTVTPL